MGTVAEMIVDIIIITLFLDRLYLFIKYCSKHFLIKFLSFCSIVFSFFVSIIVII